MLSAMFAGALRHRRMLLSGAVVLMVGVVGLASLLPGLGRDLLSLLVSLLAIPLVVLTLVAYRRPRQAAFVVDPRPPAFRAPPHEGQLFFTITAMSFTTEGILGRLAFHGGPGTGPAAALLRVEDTALWMLATVLIALTAVHLALAWQGIGVHLRPDGVVDRTGLGTLTVPWAALAAGYPPLPAATATRLTLTFAHPQLVRRRGLVFWSSIQASNVDPVFLAHAIGFYLANPHRRPSIGTQTEYEQLLQATTAAMSTRAHNASR